MQNRCIQVHTKGSRRDGILHYYMTRPTRRVMHTPDYPAFCQGDYHSTVTLAIRTGIVCPLYPER